MILNEGNFQDQEQMKIQKEARKQYGRFFYRFPNGESAADVYDRITGIINLVYLFIFIKKNCSYAIFLVTRS